MDAVKRRKRKKILLLSLLILVLLGSLFFIFRNQLQDRLNISPDNLFPFGNPSNRQPEDTTATSTPPVTGGVRPDDFAPIRRDRLRLLAELPTAGFIPVSSNDSYPTQESIKIYNEARGDVQISDLAVLRSPRVRLIEQRNGDIYNISANENISSITLSSGSFPEGLWSTAFLKSGDFFLVRRYDANTTNLETYGSYLRPGSVPLYCDFSNQTFSIGDEHPGIAGIKLALGSLYGFDKSNDSVDTATEELLRAWNDFEFNVGITEKVASSTTIGSEGLSELKRLCIEQQNEDLSLLPAPISAQLFDFDIDEAVISPDGSDVFTLKKVSSRYQGSLVRIDNPESKRAVFQSNFGEWLAEWNNPDAIILQTKPSHNINGYAYRLVPSTNRFEKILGDKPGLLASVSPNEQFAVYSYTNQNTNRTGTKILNLQTREERELSFKTLPDKCAWSADSSFLICAAPNGGLSANEPDAWFKGQTTYIDSIWIVSTDTFANQRIYSPQIQDNAQLDIYKISIDPFEENYVYFLDKNTNFLWSLEIDGIDGRE